MINTEWHDVVTPTIIRYRKSNDRCSQQLAKASYHIHTRSKNNAH